MTSTEDFLKSVEANIAELNAALEDDDLEDDDFDILSNSNHQKTPEYSVQDVETVIEDKSELSSTETKSSESQSKQIDFGVSIETEVPSQDGDDLIIGDVELPEIDSLLKDHHALLLKINSVLKGKDHLGSGNNSAVQSEYEEFTNEISISAANSSANSTQGDNVEENEDYFHDMDKFVESDTAVDVEKLYDVLETNLQYQDFLNKLNSEIGKRLQKNQEIQREIADEEDHLFMISRGLIPNQSMYTDRTGSKILSLQKFKSPYFANNYRIGPRMNGDQIRLCQNPRFSIYQYDSAWGKIDRSHLIDTMKSIIIEWKMSDLTKTVSKDVSDVAHDKLKNTAFDDLTKDIHIDNWGEMEWQEISMSMSSISCNRSLSDCQNQWKNYLSPGVNHGTWSKQEDALLHKMVEQHGTNNWQLISSKLGSSRRSWQCLQRYQKIRKKTITQWSVADDKHLMDAVLIYGDGSFLDLSYYMGDKSGDQCLQRWRYSICPQIKRGKWTQEEDSQIMKIISEHGFDLQKIKEVQKNRTRAQVRERIRILMAKEKSGKTGSTCSWSVQEAFQLMYLIKQHGDKNWARVRREMQMKYTAPVLFRRWHRINTLLRGTVKRVTLPWEKTFLNEVYCGKRYLTPPMRADLADLLPNTQEREVIASILENCKVKGKTGLYAKHLKRRIMEVSNSPADEVDNEEEEMQPPVLAPKPIHPDAHLYRLLRENAGKIYQKAFEVGTNSEFKMYYTPPSITTVSAFRSLLVDQYPRLVEQAAPSSTQPIKLPPGIKNSQEFNLLAARFKSLFSWPLIMGETPV